MSGTTKWPFTAPAEPLQPESSPCAEKEEEKPELNDVLRQLYRCVKNKQRVDAATEPAKRSNRTSAETLETFKLMDRFVHDAESMLTFSTSLIVKEFVLDIIVDLVHSSRSDEFTKMSLGVFKKLLDYDFNAEEDKFVFEDHVKAVYSPTFIRLIPFLNDIAVEESFYADDEDDMSVFQKDLLALLFYMFKTISLRKLITLGLKPRHLQFVIIHFTSSVNIPRLILAIAANMDRKTELDDDLSGSDGGAEMMDAADYHEVKLFTNNIYSISVRSCLLLHRYHGGSREISAILRQAFWHLANYAFKNANDPDSAATFQKMARKVVNHFRKKLCHQTTAPFVALDQHLICDYMRMIEFNIGNMAPMHRVGLGQKLIIYAKRYLEKVKTQPSQPDGQLFFEMADAAFCLITKMIHVSRDEFITLHLKIIDTMWISFLVLNNKMAFVALITLLASKVRKAPFMMFVRRFINAAIDRIHEPSCQVLLYLKPLLTLYEDYTCDPMFCEEHRVKSLMASYRAILRQRAPLNTKYLNAYLELMETLLRIHSGDLCAHMVHECMHRLEKLLLNSYDFELNPETTSRCLNIINLVQTGNSDRLDMAQYGSMLYQLLCLIQLSRRDNDWSFNCRIESYKDALSELTWIRGLE